MGLVEGIIRKLAVGIVTLAGFILMVGIVVELALGIDVYWVFEDGVGGMLEGM